VFEHAYSTSSWTAPATASLFTGLYPVQHAVVSGRMAVRQLQKSGVPVRLNRIPRRAETIAEVMRKAGYATWGVVENANLSSEMGFDPGFQHFVRLSPSHDAATITARLEELRPSIQARRPYFLYLHYMDPHEPYEEREPLAQPEAEADARRIAAYDSEVRYVDGHLRQAFRLFGWETGTLLLLTADHGEELLDHGQWGHAKTLFGEVLNVPLLAFGAGVSAPGRRVRDRVSHVDLLPTLRAVAGRPPSGREMGVSLLPPLRDPAARLPERTLYADLWHIAEGVRKPYLHAAIEGRYKLIDGLPEGPLLFDLDADPLELQNRAFAYPQVVAELQGRLRRFEARAPRLAPEFEQTVQDARLNEELRALGYVGN
jgi:arylsulfatase A-like enzyme